MLSYIPTNTGSDLCYIGMLGANFTSEVGDMPRILSLFLALLATFSFIGCGDRESAAEREIEKRAPQYIGPAESYQATVEGLSSRSVSSVTLIGTAVQPEPHLVVDPLELRLTNVQFRTDPFEVTSVENATFSGRISEAALNTYINQSSRPTFGNIRDARVELLNNRVRATAEYVAPGLTVPVSTSGRLRVDRGIQVVYVPEQLEVGNIPVPAATQGLLASRVNPLVDLSGLRFHPRIERLEVREGELLISGTARLRGVEQAAR